MIEVSGVSVGYRDAEVLSGVSMCVEAGELVVLVGENGAGKSTLGRLLCASLLADGGCVLVDGHNPAEGGLERLCVRELVGYVQQDPCDQIVSALVYDEVAFGPRNLGCAEDEVAERVAEALSHSRLAGFDARLTSELSGGEQQRVALAGVLAMRPRYLVLDEVTAQLDPAARAYFRSLFSELAHERGLGVVLITHDPAELALADRVIELGEVDSAHVSGAGSGVIHERDTSYGGGNADGAAADSRRSGVYDSVLEVESSLTLDDGSALGSYGPCDAAVGTMAENSTKFFVRSGDVALEMRGVSFSYGEHWVLDGVDMTVRAGEVVLLEGESGAGKSTLAAVAAGLVEPDVGIVRVGGVPVRIGAVGCAFQQPEAQFFLDTVYDELAFVPRNFGCSDDEVDARVRRASRQVGLDADLLDRYPFELSGGQARRVALASVLTLGASAYVLDEPSAALDARGRAFAHAFVRELARGGAAVVVISHDVEEWKPVAHRVLRLEGGRLTLSGEEANSEGSSSRCSSASSAVAGSGGAGASELSAPCPVMEEDFDSLVSAADRPSSSLLGDVSVAPGHVLPPMEEDAGISQSNAHRPPFIGRGEIQSAHDHPIEHKSDVERLRTPAGRTKAREGRLTPFAGYRRDAPLSSVDARVKIVVLLAATFGVFAASGVVAFAGWALALAAVLASAWLSPARVLRGLRPVVIVLAFTVLANLVSCDGSASHLIAGPVGLDAAGGLRGLTAVERIIVLVGLSLAVAATTTGTQISDACVRLLTPLARLGVPVAALGTVLSLALRFIPLVSEELTRIRMAQRARGAAFDEGGLVQRIGAWASVLTPLVVGLFRRADRLGEAMAARCYGAPGTHRPPAPRPLAVRDRLVLALGLAIIVALTLLGNLAR